MLTIGARGHQSVDASGNGGQFLVVWPALQLAIGVTAGNYGDPAWTKIRQELVQAVVRATL